MCRFAAFECLEAGARDYVGLLRGRFPEAYAAAELGDGTAFVKALKARGYFTATLGQYLATFIGVLKMVDDRMRTDPSPPPSETQPAVAVSPDVFTFSLLPGESVRDRIVRCCDEAAQFGPMGDALLRPRYASFVACGLAGWDYDALPTVRTSCAIVQGSVDRWCHRPGAGSGSRRGLVGGGMFHGWLGDLSYQHPAWRPAVHGFPVVGDPGPRPGDLFYVAVNATSNNDHVGRFLRETSPGVWETFEGGGGDGTRTGKSSRTLGPHFDAYGRVLLGWWDADLMGYEAF
jgi:hypothetical protein